MCEDGIISPHTNFITISTLTFFLQKQLSKDKTKDVLNKILKFTQVIDATKEDATNCINSNFDDPERWISLFFGTTPGKHRGNNFL